MLKRICAAGLLAALPISPLVAQDSPEQLRNFRDIMRACSAIENLQARVACYDNNVAPADAIAGSTQPVAAPPRRQAAASPSGFGGEDVPRSIAATQREQQNRIETRVAGASELQPGIFRVTLEDGAVWEFTDSAPPSYHVPVTGSEVTIRRGSLGGYRLQFDDQLALRVKRVR